MIYLFHWKKLTMERNKILSFQQLNSVVLAKEMDLNQVILQIGAPIVVVMAE